MNTMENMKKRNNLNNLSPQQLKTLTDIKDFLNLSEGQIIEYIYSGNEVLFKSDIRYLIQKGILEKIKQAKAYYITKKGSWLVAGLTGDTHIYNKLIRSRYEELSHDMFIYSAFKHLENQLKSEGKTITRYRTIRQMKSEDMKIYGRMRTVYPNLYVEYANESTGVKNCINIVLCLSSTDAEILKKSSLPNVVWYTHKESRKSKILRLVENADVNIIQK